MVNHLLSKGYKRSEIYGTTWGDGGLTTVALIDLKCSYVKQIRHEIFFNYYDDVDCYSVKVKNILLNFSSIN